MIQEIAAKGQHLYQRAYNIAFSAGVGPALG